MIAYKITPGTLKTFSVPGKPFLSFDQFLNVVQWYRDYHYAMDHVERFEDLAGKVFSVWTVRQTSEYLRHVWLDQLSSDLVIEFEIPHLKRNATFPLIVTLSSEQDGVLFRNHQELAVERSVNGKFVLTAWRKIPELSNFLLGEVSTKSSCSGDVINDAA